MKKKVKRKVLKKRRKKVDPTILEAEKVATAADEKIDPIDEFGTLIFARDCEMGVDYLNWSRMQVMQLVGVENKEIVFTALCHNGDVVKVPCKPYYPLVFQSAKVKELHTKHLVGKGVLQKLSVKMGVTIKRDEEGNVVVKAPSKSRGNKDPKTGYGTGTDGNLFAHIILKHGVSKDVKKTVLKEIFDILIERFDEKKSKGLASSWYSTVKRKNPQWWTE